ncbi:hypothetical protein JW979_11650, partial [bacterium]|nr:hypothetical protein [candidate division CSSED10-310 bacterium]
RAEKYYVEGNFEKDIQIRKNIHEILTADLVRLKEKGTVIIGSGVTDPYQPCEKDECLMPEIIETFSERNLSVAVLTKSSLVNRDLEEWKILHRRAGFILMVSLTMVDDTVRQIFEPQAGTVSERIETMRRFKRAGCHVGVLAMPFLPFINDSIKDIELFADVMQSVPVDFVLPGSLTLRPGKQKNVFLNTIKTHFPEHYTSYTQLYSLEKPSGVPNYTYRKTLFRRIHSILSKRSLSTLIPHRIYRHHYPIQDEIYILLNHMADLYSRKGIPVHSLLEALQKYREWLITERKRLNRSRKLDGSYIESKLNVIRKQNRLNELFGNRKLARFIDMLWNRDNVFDYRLLSWTEAK